MTALWVFASLLGFGALGYVFAGVTATRKR